MDHTAFHALLNKYLEGKCSVEEDRLIQQWYELLDDDRPYSFFHPSDWDELENKLWEKIQLQKIVSPPPEVIREKKIPLFKILKWTAAASVILLLGVISVYSLTSGKSYFAKEMKKDWVIDTNNSDKPKIIILEDGSSVSLKPGGRIEHILHISLLRHAKYF